mgnify:CR=1 FL=1
MKSQLKAAKLGSKLDSIERIIQEINQLSATPWCYYFDVHFYTVVRRLCLLAIRGSSSAANPYNFRNF